MTAPDRRPDGTPKAFWYQPSDPGHYYYRDPDGYVCLIGEDCRHDVQARQ